jgi:hypothetical protein
MNDGAIAVLRIVSIWALLSSGISASAGRLKNSDISLVRVPNNGIQPQAIVDRAGILHLLYYFGDAGHGNLFYVKSPDAGLTWSAPLRVNSVIGTAVAAGTIRGGQIAIGKNGRIHVAWNGSSESEPKRAIQPELGQPGAPMLYSRLNDARTGFEPERNLMTRTFGLDGGGTIAADPTGHVYVSWHGKAVGAVPGEAGRQVWITRSDDDGKTFAAEQPASQDSTGACGCCGMSVYAGSKGSVRVLYRSATENVHRDIYLLTSHDYANSFESRKLHPWEINACPMTSMAFSEGAGKLEGAWETSGQVYFENLDYANAVPVSAPGESKGRKHPRLAISPDGGTLMAWIEGSGWGRGGSLRWQVYSAGGKPTGEKGTVANVPAWSFGAVAAKQGRFLIIY